MMLLRDEPRWVETLMKKNALRNEMRSKRIGEPASVPETASLNDIARSGAAACTACPLYKKGDADGFR